MFEKKREEFSHDAEPQLTLSPSARHDEISLAAVWATFHKRKALVLWPALIIFSLAAYVTFTEVPMYESTATLEIDPNRSGDLGLGEMIDQKLGNSDSSDQIKTQISIIESDDVAARVIKALDLAHNRAFTGTSASADSPSDPAEMHPLDRQAILGAFHGALRVQPIASTMLVRIQVRNPDPKLATKIANTLIDEYMQRNLQVRYDGTAQVSNWLEKQMQDIQASEADAQHKLSDFQKEHNILGTDENDNVVTDRLKLLNQQLSDAEADRIVKEARYRLAATGNPEMLASTMVSTSTLQILRGQQADLKGQLAALSAKYGSGYPKVHEMQQQLRQLDGEISAEVANVGKRLEDEYQSAAKTESLVRAQFEEQKREAFKLNEHAVQFSVLKHEVESGQELYDTLQLKLKEAGVTAGLSSSYISVVDHAQEPALPVTPRKTLNLEMGLLGGLFVGMVLAFVVESVDDTVRTFDEVEQSLRLPTLGSIPLFAEKSGLKGLTGTNGSAHKVGPISFRHPHSAFAEACRAVCSGILLSSIDRTPKLLVITSSFPQEGKSTVSSNLAFAFAQRGKKVLLIDGDLRRPTIHRVFGMENGRGVTTTLSEELFEQDFATPLQEFPNLKVLAAGPTPPAPAELLASGHMQEFLVRCLENFDHVLIDSAPLLPVTDALSLCAQADAVVLVARAGLARRRALRRLMTILSRAHVTRLGVVLNAVDLQLDYYYLSSKYSKKYTYSGYYGKLPEHKDS